MLYAFACLALGGCVTNNLSTQNAQLTPVDAAVPTRPPVPAPGPAMTPTARLANAKLITVNKTTMAGHILRLASPQSLARDCTPLGQVDAKVLTSPENGTIHIEQGMAFLNDLPGDAPYACDTNRRWRRLVCARGWWGGRAQNQ